MGGGKGRPPGWWAGEVSGWRDGEKEWVSEGLWQSGAASDEEPLSLAGRIRNTDMEGAGGIIISHPPIRIPLCSVILSYLSLWKAGGVTLQRPITCMSQRSCVFGGFQDLVAEPGENTHTNRLTSLQACSKVTWLSAEAKQGRLREKPHDWSSAGCMCSIPEMSSEIWAPAAIWVSSLKKKQKKFINPTVGKFALLQGSKGVSNKRKNYATLERLPSVSKVCWRCMTAD